MSVKIDLDLQAGEVMGKLETIRAELETLNDDDFDLGLDLDIGDQLDDIGDQLDQIGTDFRTDMDAGVSRLEDIEGIDTSGLQVGTGGDSGGDTGSDSGDGSDGRSWKRVLYKARESSYHKGFDDIAKQFGGSDGRASRFRGLGGKDRMKRLSRMGTSIIPDRDRKLFDVPEFGPTHLPGLDMGDSSMFGMLSDMDDGDGPSPFKKAIPNMRTWYRMLGAIIPMLATMIVQAAGVAVAMGGVAVAGASLIGIGLLGHGEDMAEAWGNAKAQLSQLKDELFEAAQPAAQAFAPISEEFLNWAPSQVNKLAHELKGLTAFDDMTFDMARGFTDWLGEMAQGLISNKDAVVQLSRRFGNLIGQGILDLFQWLTESAAANQDMLVELGGAFMKVAGALYQVFVLVSRLIIVLTPLFNGLSWLAKQLRKPIVGAFAIFITLLGIAIYAIIQMSSAIAWLSSNSLMSLIPTLTGANGMLSSFALHTIFATDATWGLVTAISALMEVATIGLATGLAAWGGLQAYKGMKRSQKLKKQMNLDGGSMGSVGSSTGTGGPSVYNEGDTYLEVNGDMDGPTTESVNDQIAKQKGIDNIRERPNPTQNGS